MANDARCGSRDIGIIVTDAREQVRG